MGTCPAYRMTAERLPGQCLALVLRVGDGFGGDVNTCASFGKRTWAWASTQAKVEGCRVAWRLHAQDRLAHRPGVGRASVILGTVEAGNLGDRIGRGDCPGSGRGLLFRHEPLQAKREGAAAGGEGFLV